MICKSVALVRLVVALVFIMNKENNGTESGMSGRELSRILFGGDENISQINRRKVSFIESVLPLPPPPLPPLAAVAAAAAAIGGGGGGGVAVGTESTTTPAKDDANVLSITPGALDILTPGTRQFAYDLTNYSPFQSSLTAPVRMSSKDDYNTSHMGATLSFQAVLDAFPKVAKGVKRVRTNKKKDTNKPKAPRKGVAKLFSQGTRNMFTTNALNMFLMRGKRAGTKLQRKKKNNVIREEQGNCSTMIAQAITAEAIVPIENTIGSPSGTKTNVPSHSPWKYTMMGFKSLTSSLASSLLPSSSSPAKVVAVAKEINTAATTSSSTTMMEIEPIVLSTENEASISDAPTDSLDNPPGISTEVSNEENDSRSCRSNSDDDDSDDDSFLAPPKIKLNVGDEIEFFREGATHGDASSLKSSVVEGIRPDETFILNLTSGNFLYPDHLIRILPDGHFRSIDTFTLEQSGEQEWIGGQMRDTTERFKKVHAAIKNKTNIYWSNGAAGEERGDDVRNKENETPTIIHDQIDHRAANTIDQRTLRRSNRRPPKK